MTSLQDVRKAVRVARSDGVTALAARAIRRNTRLWGALSEELPLRAEDVVHSSEVRRPPPGPRRGEGCPLTVGWVITPPGPGSGGHTTIFRLVRALEEVGHRCVLFVYDTRNEDVRQHERTIRTWWPSVRAEVLSARAGLTRADAWIATSWPTAHVLARAGDVPGRRLYLVQDFEPWFYPRGAAHDLAEDTYRFGFSPITIGPMLADELQRRFGARATVAPFGADLGTYGVRDAGPRDELVFFSRPGVARRGHDLGVLALAEFHRLRPDVPINTFGTSARLPFPARVHPQSPPRVLDGIYARCRAGLVLSFTNVSLVPYELLAAGVVPVLNDHPAVRATLDGPHVRWARATPTDLARALVDAVDDWSPALPDRLAASVRDLSWEPARHAVVAAVQRACAE